MIDYTVNYWAGFYHMMQRGRKTEVCWNNNKANVFPVQTDTPLMGCQTNFLLSERWRQPNRHSNHNSSHLWALRGNIHMPHYHPLRLMITCRRRKNINLLYCEENCISAATYTHMCSQLTLKPAWRSPQAPQATFSPGWWYFLFCFLLSHTDARTAWRCCLCAARGTACSATHPWGRATSACSSSKTRL